MNVLIIEDEPLAAKQLISFIKEIHPDFTVLATLNSISKCFDWFESNAQPDLIFSDIELLDGNVFNFYDKQSINCPIIFTTAYDQFLMKAFDGNGIAYLLKPLTKELVEKAILKCNTLQTKAQPVISPDILQLLQKSLQQEATNLYKQRFTIKTRNGIYLLPVSDIAFIQADSVLVYAFDFNGKKYPLTGTLIAAEQQLNPENFFKINRSDIVSITAIEKISPHIGDRLAVYIKGQKEFVVTSAQKTSIFRKWIDR
ncbi:LytTR family DNA-binding domain-containing protein [Flavobacterium sp. MC2016-06]|jgi:two-component system response regulator LytT|uniref:LytR/AlgR family response regulator transcription factor n=1 Tax=Flavobacterium sp. MC2016-06 TaxID=2676308 RepID=UPI0012BA66E5|nr:LytTR family DNA-binding domain-containing protein [Flavobacterium sp. MC2016-06]MBU3860694.1 LytTR family DNA-binding domain-containing protein [Flavobacterium sp. MC2016-06]